MDFTDEWKSLFPVSKVFAPPLLSDPSSSSKVGPLFFNPSPKSQTLLFSSSSLFPPILSPAPQNSLHGYLSTSSLPPSTSSSIASQFGPQQHDDAISGLSYNCLQLLHCPKENRVIIFFATGCNHDQLGFLVISFNKSGFDVLTDKEDSIFVAKNKFHHKISKILVNQIEDISSSEANSSVTVGYLLVYTMYSVHWFGVEVNEINQKPMLTYLGFYLFKSCSIVGACWSPHLLEECVVLLENGVLFRFDMNSSFRGGRLNANGKGKRFKVSWDGDSCTPQNCKWLGCEFSWHPRILIVARSDAAFLVDLRSDECNVTLLAKIEMLRLYAVVETEQFLVFSKVKSDGFLFVLASDSLLVLCDVRKPLMPILQWAHGLDKPSFIETYRLSDLRLNSRDDTYEWADKLGSCILLGSFWNCEFSLFCYGPPIPYQSGPFASKISNFCQTLNAWELPSNLILSGRGCSCGSCLVRDEFMKCSLPIWIDWQQKKDIVLGFGILDRDLSQLINESDEFGGFTLIRLMSSGKLEAQRYCASWNPLKRLEIGHGDSPLQFEDNLLCHKGEEDYRFPKRFKYLKLDYLYGHLKGNLSEVLDLKLKNSFNYHQQNGSFSIDFHEILCEKLKACGLSRYRTSPAISSIFGDINFPASIREVALRRVWSSLPVDFLQLAFSSYGEVLQVLLDQKKVSLEFLVVPDLLQLPPFFLRKSSSRSNKWSQKVQRTDALVGPVLPLPLLVTLHEFQNGCPSSEEEASAFSSEMEVSLSCDEVMQVASELAVCDIGYEFQDNHVVSLADNRDDMWIDSQKPKPFILHHPPAFHCFPKDQILGNSVYEDVRFTGVISKVFKMETSSADSVGLDMFDDLCPISLQFDTCDINFMSSELKFCKIMKKQFSRWQESFSLYQDFCTQFKLGEHRT